MVVVVVVVLVVVLSSAPVAENIQVLNTSRNLRLDKVIKARDLSTSSPGSRFGSCVHDGFATFTRLDTEVIKHSCHL